MKNHVSLYRLFDHRAVLLYVGITSRATLRQCEHAADQPWWDLVATQTFVHFATREDAAAAELEAIRVELPVFNVIGATGGLQRREVYALGLIDQLLDVQRVGLLRRRAGEALPIHLGEVPMAVLGDALAAGLIDLPPRELRTMADRSPKIRSIGDVVDALHADDRELITARARGKLSAQYRQHAGRVGA